MTIDRETLGKIVRGTWVAYCISIGDTKTSHVAGWDELSEADKEVDRRIGEAVRDAIMRERDSHPLIIAKVVGTQLIPINVIQWQMNKYGDYQYIDPIRDVIAHVALLEGQWRWYTTDKEYHRTSSEFGPFTSADAAKADYEVMERTK